VSGLGAIETFDFEPHYKAHIVSSPTRAAPLRHTFQQPRKGTGSRGPWLIVEVTAQSAEWSGAFEYGDPDYSLTGLFALPSPDHLLVLARGTPYIVPVHAPATWRLPPTYPVLGIRCVIGADLVMLWDFQNLAVYGPEGLLWSIDDVATDDLTVTEANSGLLRGTLTNGGSVGVPFRIRAHTGEVEEPPTLLRPSLVRGERGEPIPTLMGDDRSAAPRLGSPPWLGFERDPLHRAIDWVLARVGWTSRDTG
jgi:hypothetical protein